MWRSGDSVCVHAGCELLAQTRFESTSIDEKDHNIMIKQDYELVSKSGTPIRSRKQKKGKTSKQKKSHSKKSESDGSGESDVTSGSNSSSGSDSDE